MRKMKRLIALVTVAMFLFAFAVAPAMAATKEESFGRLKALSVAIGDATGNPQYDKAFTRAEAAAIMVNLLGMKAAIDAAKGNTKFKDVTASYWGSGVINLAVGSGVIKGYPDGTFKPDANVTYAEMSAMLVQVLGYGPKLTGTWPSNVIGKAAQLGLLDGVNVTDYNAAAIRANVFMAADNALDVKPLTETKNGFEEDTKTLMEKKLSVVKHTVALVDGTPAYDTSVEKGKISLKFDTEDANNTDGTFDVADTINPDDFYGLKAEAWVKDDKVFFLNVKTSSSDVIVDTIDEMRDSSNAILSAANAHDITDGTNGHNALGADVSYLKLKTTGRLITLAPGTTEYFKNFGVLGASPADINLGASVKVILGSNGKAAYVLCTSYKTAVVDSVDTANEKITFDSDTVHSGDSSTVTLKDKRNSITRNGAMAKLADIKKGDVVDYIDASGSANPDVRVIAANDKTVTGKLTGILDDGTSADALYNVFIFKVGDQSLNSAKNVFYSTNSGDTFIEKAGGLGTATGNFTSVLNKDVTVKLNKSGKAVYLIAGSASNSNEIPVVIRSVKKVTATETTRYLYVTKFDGTNTYYPVTTDTKIDGDKINEYALKQTDDTANGVDYSDDTTYFGPIIKTDGVSGVTLKAGDVVKVTLNADGTLNEVKTYGSDLEQSLAARTITVNKDNNTFAVQGGTTLLVDDATKILKSKTELKTGLDALGYATEIRYNLRNTTPTVWDEFEAINWSAVKTINDTVAANAVVIKDGGKAKYIVLLDKDTTTATSDYYGTVVGLGTNTNGDGYVTVGYDGQVKDLVGSMTGNGGAAKKKVVTFNLKANGDISTGWVNDPQSVYKDDLNNAYTKYKVDSFSGSQIKLIPVDDTYTAVEGTTGVFVLYSTTKTKFWDCEADTTTPVAITDPTTLVGKYVNIYDLWNADGNTIDANHSGTIKDVNPAHAAQEAGDNVFDIITLIKN